MASSAFTTSTTGSSALELPQSILSSIPRDLGPGAKTIDLPPNPAVAGTGYYNPDIDSFDYRPLVEAVKCLYLCEPRDALFPAFFAPDATFEDPAGKLAPFHAFKGLAQLFRPDSVERWQVTDVTRERVRIEVVMKYQPRLPEAISPAIGFRTLLTLTLNSEGKIVHLKDEWMGSPLLFKEDGFLGKLAEVRRVITGAGQKAFVSLTGGAKVQSANQPAAAAAPSSSGPGKASTQTAAPMGGGGGAGANAADTIRR